MKNFNVGILGAGNIIHAHLSALLNMKDIKIKWVADINNDNLMQISKAYSLNTINIKNQRLELTDIDIILIIVPYGARPEYYNLFMNKSIALYVEKPFAKTMEEHLNICAGFEKYKIACGLQRRALGKVNILKKVIQEELFGKLNEISFEWGNTTVSRGLSYQNDPSLSGGGILFDVAIHGIDIFFFLTEAQHFILKSKKIINDEDLNIDIHSELQFDIFDRAGLLIKCNSVVSQLTNTSNKFIFEFMNANIEFSLFDEEPIKIVKNGNYFSFIDVQIGNLPKTSSQVFFVFWRSFLDAITSKNCNYTSAINSIMTTKFIEEVYKN